MNLIPVVYENDEILIINKRSGLAAQGGQGVTACVDRLLAEQTGYPVFLVHRLDKETAGLLVVAKSSRAAAKWTALLQSGDVTKTYAAITFGVPPQKRGTLATDVRHKDRVLSALTRYELVEVFSVPAHGAGSAVDGSGSGTGVPATDARLPATVPLSLLKVTLGTGRTHQIRIHLAEAGLPIVLDDKYGDFKANKQFQKAVGTKRLCLAAVKLSIPLDGKTAGFTVPLPPHMQSLVGEDAENSFF